MKRFKIHRVLVPVDFSPVAENAIQTAAAICRRHQAAMTIVHIVESNYHPLFTPSAAMAAGTILPRLVRDAKDNLSHRAMQLMRKHGIIVRHVVQSGNPADEICKTAFREKDSLIVMGTQRNSSWANLFVGTTAYRVIKNAPCPVLTVPEGSAWLDFKRVLFPVRRVSKGLEKYDYLLPIAKANDSSVLVAGVARKFNEKDLTGVEAGVDAVKRQLNFDEILHWGEMHFTENEARLVLDLAESEKSDLLVITATRDTSIKEFFLGPFAQDVVNQARCPVLSVRPGKDPETPEADVMFATEPLATG